MRVQISTGSSKLSHQRFAPAIADLSCTLLFFGVVHFFYMQNSARFHAHILSLSLSLSLSLFLSHSLSSLPLSLILFCLSFGLSLTVRQKTSAPSRPVPIQLWIFKIRGGKMRPRTILFDRRARDVCIQF